MATPTLFPNGTPRRLSATAVVGPTPTLPGVREATNIEVRCTRIAERKGSGIPPLRHRSQILDVHHEPLRDKGEHAQRHDENAGVPHAVGLDAEDLTPCDQVEPGEAEREAHEEDGDGPHCAEPPLYGCFRLRVRRP